MPSAGHQIGKKKTYSGIHSSQINLAQDRHNKRQSEMNKVQCDPHELRG
jgi:hypothetical protein